MNVDLLDVARFCVALFMVTGTLAVCAVVLLGVWRTVRDKNKGGKG